MSVNYRELKNKWKESGEIPEWYSTNALQFFMDSYSHNGESVNSRDETTNKWLASYAPTTYPDWWNKDVYFKGLTYEEAFNKLDRDGYLMKSTPLKANAGLPQRGLTVSCCGQKMDNSVASKAFTRGELEILIKNSHGCSMSVTDWLSEGTVYDADGNISAGVEPIISDFQHATEEINQGVRRGQTVFAVDVLHGDFWKIAKKLYLERATLNISWLITDDFLKRLKDGDEEVVARWEEVLYVRMTTGKGYFTKIDTMNRNKAQTFKNLDLKVYASNLCVAPETKILTKNGYEIISDLEGQDVEVWNGSEWSETTVVKTGENQELWTVKTSSNQSIDVTPYHKWYVQTGYSKGAVVVKRTSDLKIGDKLVKFDLPTILGDKKLENAYTNGFYSGDGCFYGGVQMTYLYHQKKELLEKLEDVRSVYDDVNQNRIVVKHHGNLKQKYFVPNSTYTVDSRLTWLAGLLDSDGTVARNGTNESLQISSIHIEFLREIQLMLQTLGVHSKINNASDEGYRKMPLNNGTGLMGDFYCQQSWRLLLSSSGLFLLAELGLKTHRLKWDHRLPQRNAEQFVTVESVENNGRKDDTYCANESKRHKLVFNGVLTGNCNEVNLPSSEEYSFTCVIVNANLTLWDTFPEHLFHVLHLIQDCNVSGYIDMISQKKGLNALFLSKVKKFTEDFRAVGTGVAGFHSLLMQKGLVYGEFESMLLNEEIFSRMKRDTNEMNVWLADVLGVPDGVKKAGLHLRNATTMMMPPTKSSAELSRNSPSEGINPETAMVKIKESVGGDLERINTAFLALMKSRGMYNKSEVYRIAENKGSVQDCDWLTEHEKKVFRVAFEIPMEDHLTLCSQRQPYIDQQQSINLFFSGSDSEEYIGKIHRMALEDDNINGLYYCYSSRGGRYVRPESCVMCQ